MAAPHEPAPSAAITRKCVLIVEDNALNMNLFSAMIGAQGYEVLQAANGSIASDLAHGRHPDLIIMDIQLPGMSGLDVTHTLKAADDTHEIPILVTSAYATSADDAIIRASGCDGYMAKPIAISAFLELVEVLMMEPACDPVG